MSAFTTERRGGVAIVTFDTPHDAVNKISKAISTRPAANQVAVWNATMYESTEDFQNAAICSAVAWPPFVNVLRTS